jgi:uncharacterized protein (TIGR02118 family)
MILFNVMYPETEGAKFDEDYYLSTHMNMVVDRLSPFGMKVVGVSRGLGGGAPGDPATYRIMAQISFPSMEDMQSGMGKHGGEIIGDVPNFTNILPVVQVSEALATALMD